MHHLARHIKNYSEIFHAATLIGHTLTEKACLFLLVAKWFAQVAQAVVVKGLSALDWLIGHPGPKLAGQHP